MSAIIKANVATGLVNLLIPTMYMSDWIALLVLSAYIGGISAVAWMFKDSRLWKI